MKKKILYSKSCVWKVWDNYTILWEYIKCVLSSLIEVVYPANQIHGEIHHFYKKRECIFNVLLEYIIIFRVKEAKGKYVGGRKSKWGVYFKLVGWLTFKEFSYPLAHTSEQPFFHQKKEKEKKSQQPFVSKLYMGWQKTWSNKRKGG